MLRGLVNRFRDWISSLDPYDHASLERDGLRPAQLDEAPIKKKVTTIALVAFVLFAVWAVWAPLDDGVLAPGTVVVKGNRKAVQHPTGGVVQEIHVGEGAKVKQGDVLITLNPLSIEAELNAAELEYINALATLSRVVSERIHKPRIEWSAAMVAYQGDPRLEDAKRLQTEIFRSRTAELRGQQSILTEQVAGLDAQLKGLEQAVGERKYQIKMVTEEAKNMAELAAEGFVPKVHASQAERSRSDLVAGIATGIAEQSRTEAARAGARLQLVQLLSVYHKDLDNQISELQKAQQALAAKVEALKFNRNLTSIRAPAEGNVVGLKVHTVGGVIQGGTVLMEIVPVGRGLVVDGQVPPQHIDKIQMGMQVDLRFTAFNMVTTPQIPGTVILVGADKQTSTSTSATALAGQGTDFYLVQVEATEADMKLLGSQVVQPGMPVEVMFKTGERSFVSLLVKPITDRFARAFKE